MRNMKVFDAEQAPYELGTLAWLLRRLSQEIFVGTRTISKAEEGRIVKFRKAVLAAIPRRGVWEKVTHEIVENQYRAALGLIQEMRRRGTKDQAVLEWLSGGLVQRELKSRDGRTVVVSAPCPVSKAEKEEFKANFLGKGTPSDLAKLITAWRLGINEDKVKDAPSENTYEKKESDPTKRYRVSPPDSLQLFLETAYIDFSSCKQTTKTRMLRAQILDALLVSEYDPFCVYYLVQVCNDLSSETSLALVPAEDIGRVCSAVCMDRTVPEEFSLAEWLQTS